MGEIPNSAGHAAVSAMASVAAYSAVSLTATIVESRTEANISTSLDGLIIGWNSAATQLACYTANEFHGQHWQFLNPPDDLKDVSQAVRHFQRGENTFRIAPESRDRLRVGNVLVYRRFRVASLASGPRR